MPTETPGDRLGLPANADDNCYQRGHLFIASRIAHCWCRTEPGAMSVGANIKFPMQRVLIRNDEKTSRRCTPYLSGGR